MTKPWSISTTVRNPDRILPFLRVLNEMEGEIFDEEGQVKYQTLLIQNRLYHPTKLSNDLLDYYETPGDRMSFSQAQKIFQHMLDNSKELQKDPGLRGRTSVAPLTKMGIAIAKKSSGAVAITELGKAYLEEKIDIGELYFRFFIKWQIPNPDSNDYKLKSGHNIKPFIGTLHLINQVNLLAKQIGEKPKGISKEEFALFCPTLINFSDIDSYAKQVISLRSELKAKDKQEQKIMLENFKYSFAKKFLNNDNEEEINKLLNNLKDYGDNAIRYFRLTRYLHIRGNGFFVDLEPRRSIEINSLLDFDDARSIDFDSQEQYLNYVSDISQPKLPWETNEKLTDIINQTLEDINFYESKNNLQKRLPKDYSRFSEQELKNYINELRIYRRSLQNQEDHDISQKVSNIQEYITQLENIYQSDNQPILLEKLSALSLHALNDAIEIKPNYPVGDDNEPTFTAPAGKPDIECFYKNFNAICEVTMLTRRDQWYNEGQPVMRHLRDFENSHKKLSYCLFIAPKLHRDTLNTFWNSIKYEYEGEPQKILPFTIANFTKILKILLRMKNEGRFLRHELLIDLYESILNDINKHKNVHDWFETIPNVIDSWGEDLLRT